MKVTLTSESAAVIMLAYPDGNRAILLTENGEDECECCTEAPGVCDTLTEWRIVEAGNKVDQLSGPIVINAGIYGQYMNNFPNSWGVPHYNGALPLSLSMKLEVKCKGSWKKIDEWSADVKTCLSNDGGGTGGGDRFPTKAFACYDPPAPCDCARRAATPDECVDPPVPCPPVCPGTPYDPPNGDAYKFTGAADGEWTNLKNWKDVEGRSPAKQLPDASSVVEIDGDLKTIPTGVNASVSTVTVTAAGKVRIPLTTNHATVRGKIGEGASEACGNGNLIMAGSDAAEFEDDGTIEHNAKVTGDANFNDASINSGRVTLDANFHDTSHNDARVDGDATFDGTASNTGNDGVGKTSTFNGHSVNSGTLYDDMGGAQDAYFHDDSTNTGRVGVVGFSHFDGNAKNKGSVDRVDFSGYSMNDTDGVCVDVAAFSDHAHNDGRVTLLGRFFGESYNNTGGTVLGGGEFTDNSTNRGSVTGATSFDASSRNTPGTVTGNARFIGDSANGGTVTGTATFNVTAHNGENTNNGTVGGNATFEDGAYNSGTCSADASFAHQSYNGAGGIVSGNATFSGGGFLGGSSRNDGTVSGDATFNDASDNNNIVVGTATFNDASNSYGTAAIIVCNTTGVCTPYPPPEEEP